MVYLSRCWPSRKVSVWTPLVCSLLVSEDKTPEHQFVFAVRWARFRGFWGLILFPDLNRWRFARKVLYVLSRFIFLVAKRFTIYCNVIRSFLHWSAPRFHIMIWFGFLKASAKPKVGLRIKPLMKELDKERFVHISPGLSSTMDPFW